jgi:hypothetical protein
MRKFFARFLTPFLTVWMCWIPSQAYAVAPLLVPVLGEVVLSNGARIALTQVVSAGVGTAIAYLAVNYAPNPSDPSQIDTLRVPVSAALPVPPPDAPASVPVSGGGTTSEICLYAAGAIQYGFCGADSAAACASAGGRYDGPMSFGCYITSGTASPAPGCGGTSSYCHASYYQVDIATPTSCSDGYVVSGTSCVLSDARAATPDGACDLQRSGSALAMISDPDCPALTTADMINACVDTGIECSIIGGAPSEQIYRFTGVDSVGQPVQISVIPTVDGGSVINQQQQRVSGGQTVVDTLTMTTNAGGQITGVSSQTATGSVPTDGTASTPGSDVLPVDIVFPSDYARSGEVQDAIDSISPSIQQMTDALTVTDTVIDPIVPGSTDLSTFGNAFDAVTGWSLPAHSSACPTPSVDLSSVLGAGNVFTMSAHCDLINEHFGIFQAASLVVWSLMALFIVLRA